MTAAAGLLLLIVLAFFSGRAHALDYFVSPRGDDGNPGDHWERSLRTIQTALALAQPGDTITLATGEYWEDVQSVRSGTPEAPISITGSAGATIRGAGGRSRVVELNHSHITLANLIIDGQVGGGGRAEDFRDKLLYVMGTNSEGVTGIRIINVVFRNAGGECLRLKYFSHHNEIAYSQFYNCGIHDFRFAAGGKNGEAIYIGTAPEQLDRNPSTDPDASDGNRIHHNYFDTRGNECVDIKEGARHNIVEHNECTGQQDSNAAGMSARGTHNVFRFNLVRDNIGAGIRLGGDTDDDGVYNEVYGNTLLNNAYSGLKIMALPQTALCGNNIGPAATKAVRGRYADGIDPRQPCSQ